MMTESSLMLDPLQLFSGFAGLLVTASLDERACGFARSCAISSSVFVPGELPRTTQGHQIGQQVESLTSVLRPGTTILYMRGVRHHQFESPSARIAHTASIINPRASTGTSVHPSADNHSDNAMEILVGRLNVRTSLFTAAVHHMAARMPPL